MVIIKSDAEIDAMRPAGHFAYELLDAVEQILEPGISTQDIDDFVVKKTKERGGVSAPLNYHGFPKSVCTSINHVVCHGIPNKKQLLKDGDIINVDVTPIIDGYHGDSSRTYFIGGVDDRVRALVETTKKCLELGIREVKDGCRIGDIGHAIQSYAEAKGYSVVREFVGHGIGKKFHEDPQIPHYGKAGRGKRLTKGMVFTIEPMINMGAWQTEILADQWTAVTKDGSLSAQFEHTLAIRNSGKVEVLTHPEGKIY